MKVVITLTLYWNALISRHFATRTGRFKGELANSTTFCIFDIPLPRSNRVPTIYLNFHLTIFELWELKSNNINIKFLKKGLPSYSPLSMTKSCSFPSSLIHYFSAPSLSTHFALLLLGCTPTYKVPQHSHICFSVPMKCTTDLFFPETPTTLGVLSFCFRTASPAFPFSYRKHPSSVP